jgi:hypothetical protein
MSDELDIEAEQRSRRLSTFSYQGDELDTIPEKIADIAAHLIQLKTAGTVRVTVEVIE